MDTAEEKERYHYQSIWFPNYFADFALRGIALGECIDYYIDWIEGTGNYTRKRYNRKKEGVPSPLDRADLKQGNTIWGENGCEVSLRVSSNEALIRFVHRDNQRPEVHWYSIVRLKSIESGVNIEHSAGRIVPPFFRLDPVASTPKILADLCNLPKVIPDCQDLFNKPVIRLNPRECENFVHHILLDPFRTLPYLVISGTIDDNNTLVDPNIVAKCLETQVVVVILHRDATREFADAFEQHGYQRSFGVCYDGAVRVYHPKINRDQGPREHYLWLPDRITGYQSLSSETLSGEVAARVTGKSIPPRFFWLLEDWDRNQSRERMEKLLRENRVKSEIIEANDAKILALDEEIEADDAAMSDLISELSAAEELNSDLINELSTQLYENNKLLEIAEQERDHVYTQLYENNKLLEIAEQERDEKAQEAEKLRNKIVAFDSAMQLRRNQSVQISDGQRKAIVESCPKNLEAALIVLQMAYPDRVEVLKSAIESAKTSKSFRDMDKAWKFMKLLIEQYWLEVQKGGDTNARKVFPQNNYAARESEKVECNRNAMERRTFCYNGEKILMVKHIKIGRSDSLFETFRLHFEYYDKEKKIIIGHCGEHICSKRK